MPVQDKERPWRKYTVVFALIYGVFIWGYYHKVVVCEIYSNIIGMAETCEGSTQSLFSTTWKMVWSYTKSTAYLSYNTFTNITF